MGSEMDDSFGNLRRSCSLPHVIGENSQTGPDRSTCRPSRQHSTQTKLTFKHTDRGLDPTAKPLQLPEPRCSLMQFFSLAQPAYLRDANFLNSGFAQFHHILGTVIAAIRRQLLGLYAQSGFGVAQQGQQFATIAGISGSNFVVKDHTGTILDQLQRAPKFYRLSKFPFANRPRFWIMKRNDPLGYR